MTKFNKKMINVLATATLVAGVAAPIAALTAPTAIHAASSFNVISTPSINSNQQDNAVLGRSKISISQASIADGASFTITLPKGFEFGKSGDLQVGRATSATDATYGLGIYLDPQDNSLDKNVAATGYNEATALKVEKLTNNSAKVTLGFDNSKDSADVYLNFANINVSGPSNGPVKATIDASSLSGITSGEVTIANVVSSGQVSLSALDTVSNTDNFTATLKVKEQTAGALANNNNIKLKLPSGFKWNAPKDASILFGDIASGDVVSNVDGDTLTVSLKKKVVKKQHLTCL